MRAPRNLRREERLVGGLLDQHLVPRLARAEKARKFAPEVPSPGPPEAGVTPY